MYIALIEKTIKSCSVNTEKLCEVFYKAVIHYHILSFDVSAAKYTTFFKVSILHEIILNLTSEF